VIIDNVRVILIFSIVIISTVFIQIVYITVLYKIFKANTDDDITAKFIQKLHGIIILIIQ